MSTQVRNHIRWFKTTFQEELSQAVEGTVFSESLLAAIAYQETGYIWGKWIGDLSADRILEICVGDTIDSPRRSAFPKHRAELEAYPQGEEMFRIAREALRLVARHEPGYASVAQNPNKFCRGFGIFQYDLQFFKRDPDYFLQESWKSFALCVENVVKELKEALGRQRWSRKRSLTHDEMVHVGIAYNRGTSNLSRGFKQGYRSSDGKYYGEKLNEYLVLAKAIEVEPVVVEPDPHPELEPIADAIFRVHVNSFLSLRERPRVNSRRLAKLPPGQIVVRRSGTEEDRFWHVETTLSTGIHRGYVAKAYLKPIQSVPADTSSIVTPIDFANHYPRFITDELEMPGDRIEEGDEGMRVQRVQEWLCLHRCDTDIDSDYGPATARSVKKFQRMAGIGQTGKVNKKTWKKLVEPLRHALRKPEGIEDMTLPQAVLAVANQHVDPFRPFEVGGENCGPWVRVYCNGKDGREWLWCAGFVTTLIHQACSFRGESPPIEGSVSCDTLANQAKAAGLFVAYDEVESGDFHWSQFDGCALFLRLKSRGDWNHTGFATAKDGNGGNLSFDTIEGNTNPGGSRNGGEARNGSRSLARHYDFVRFG